MTGIEAEFETLSWPMDPDPDALLGPFSQSDDGNALRLVAVHGHRFRRVADMRKWFVWDGQRWGS
jgi:hypothetical protein